MICVPSLKYNNIPLVLDLSKVALSSKSMCQHIEDYRTTKAGRRKFLLETDVHSLERTKTWPADIIHAFFRLGKVSHNRPILGQNPKNVTANCSFITIVFMNEMSDLKPVGLGYSNLLFILFRDIHEKNVIS